MDDLLKEVAKKLNAHAVDVTFNAGMTNCITVFIHDGRGAHMGTGGTFKQALSSAAAEAARVSARAIDDRIEAA